ncbi:MAG: hypothetical protein AAF721_22415 [Myxococcota bacterium]
MVAPPDPATEALEALARDLVADASLSWDWDGRFEMVVAAFPQAHGDAVLATVAKHAPQQYTTAELATGPTRVRDVAAALGGLRPGQRLLTSDPGAAVLIVCPWWPWNGGERISLRVGYDAGRDVATATRLAREFKTWFSL